MIAKSRLRPCTSTCHRRRRSSKEVEPRHTCSSSWVEGLVRSQGLAWESWSIRSNRARLDPDRHTWTMRSLLICHTIPMAELRFRMRRGKCRLNAMTSRRLHMLMLPGGDIFRSRIAVGDPRRRRRQWYRAMRRKRSRWMKRWTRPRRSSRRSPMAWGRSSWQSWPWRERGERHWDIGCWTLAAQPEHQQLRKSPISGFDMILLSMHHHQESLIISDPGMTNWTATHLEDPMSPPRSYPTLQGHSKEWSLLLIPSDPATPKSRRPSHPDSLQDTNHLSMVDASPPWATRPTAPTSAATSPMISPTSSLAWESPDLPSTDITRTFGSPQHTHRGSKPPHQEANLVVRPPRSISQIWTAPCPTCHRRSRLQTSIRCISCSRQTIDCPEMWIGAIWRNISRIQSLIWCSESPGKNSTNCPTGNVVIWRENTICSRWIDFRLGRQTVDCLDFFRRIDLVEASLTLTN